MLDDELMYLRLNPRSTRRSGSAGWRSRSRPVNQFLCAKRYAGRLASNSVVQYALWLNEATRAARPPDPLVAGRDRGHRQVPLLSCEQKPEVLRFAGGTDADLRIQWQEFLLRMIANAFELPPMLLGLQCDVNRSTAGEMADEAFQSAVVPVARLLAEHITRDSSQETGLARVRVLLQQPRDPRRDGRGADPDRAAEGRRPDHRRSPRDARAATAARKARRPRRRPTHAITKRDELGTAGLQARVPRSI